MAEGKKKVIFYTNWADTFKKLSNEEAGKLIKHFCGYIKDEDPEPEDRLTELLFDPIKDTLKRDLKRWEERSERNRINGQKGGRPQKTESVSEKPIGLNQNPKKADKDNDTDIDIVKDNDTVKEKSILLSSLQNDDARLKNGFDQIAFAFWGLFKSNAKTSKTTTLDKAKLEEYSKQVRLMIQTDKRTEEEIREVFNFLKTSDFWGPNIQSISKLRKQFETLYAQSQRGKQQQMSGVDEIIKKYAERYAKRNS